MNFVHPTTQKPCRVLRLSTLSARKRKTLVAITIADDLNTVRNKQRLMHIYVGIDALTIAPHQGHCVGLLLTEPSQAATEYLIAKDRIEVPLVFVSRAVASTAASVGQIRAENFIILDEMHKTYEHIGYNWNGSMDDALIMIALLQKANYAICCAENVAANRLIAAKRYGIETMDKFEPEPLIVYTQSYKIERGMRRRELMESLNRNANNPYVDEIVVFADGVQNIQMERITEAVRSKIRIVPSTPLKTIRDILAYIASEQKTGFACIMKEDCFLDGSVGHIWGMDLRDGCLALSRDDYKEERTPRDMPTMQPDNQEAWIMRAEDIASREFLNVEIRLGGAMLYQMAFNTLLLKAKFVLRNPSAHIKVHHHHESGIHVGKKLPPPILDVFVQVAPTQLQDREMVLNMRPYALMDSGKQITLDAGEFDRPLLGLTVAQQKTFTTMKNRLNRGEDYTWMDAPAKNTFRASLGICKWANAYVSHEGIVSTVSNVFIGGGTSGTAKELSLIHI